MIDRLTDTTTYTYKHNRKYSNQIYVFCIILRIILGICIFNNIIPDIAIYILFGLFIAIFSFKYHIFNKRNINTWKNYPRNIMSYVLVILFTILNKDKKVNNIGGLILILDTLIGFESRNIQNNFVKVIDISKDELF